MQYFLRKIWREGDPLVRAGQFAQALRQLSLITVALLLPRLGVTRADIGVWEQFQYLGYLLGFAWLSGLGQAYLAEVRQLDTAKARALTARLMRLVLTLTLGLGLVAWLGREPLSYLLGGGGELPGWPVYVIFLLSHWPHLMYEQVLLAQARPRRLIVVSVLANLALAGGLLVPLWLGYDWSEALPFLLLPTAVKLLTLVDSRAWAADHRAGSLPIGYLWSRALPLMGYAAIGGLIVSFDPWFVNFWYGGDQDQFALYRYGTRELPLVVAITNGIGQALLPLLSVDRETGLRQLRQSSLRLMHFFFPASILLLLTSPWWWSPLFTSTFAAALPLFQIFVFVGLSRMIFPIVVLMATGHERALPGLGAVEFVLNALLSWWLVGFYGLEGIVWATVIAYTLDKLLAAWWLYRKEGITLPQYCDLRWLLGYSGLLGLSYLLL